MLKRRIGTVGAGLLLVSSLAAAPLARAETSSDCVGVAANGNGCSEGTVTVTVTTDGQGSTLSLNNNFQPICTYQGDQIPCDAQGGWWSATRQCYVRELKPQPAQTDPLWQDVAGGQTDGTLYECVLPLGQLGPYILFWAGTPPVSTAHVVALAARAIQSLHLRAIDVGMAPTPTSTAPGSIGIVGLPVWLWVKDPTARTWGPATGTATDGALAVTVTARVKQIAWTMGDGSPTITCTNPGMPYAASYGKQPSPTCGYTGYQKQGSYTVQARSTWTIDYTSTVGVTGTMAMHLTTDEQITIGELQATAAAR